MTNLNRLWTMSGELLVVVSVISLGACGGRTPLEAGEFTSIAPDIVLTFDYQTPEFRVTAHRFSEHDPFQVVIQTRHQSALRHCIADKAFNQLLTDFESLRIHRRLSDTAARGLGQASSHHRLRYASRPPMEAYEEVLTPLPSGALSVRSEGFAYELSLTTASVERLLLACGAG